MTHGQVMPWLCRACKMSTLRFTGEHIQCWNVGCPDPGATERLLSEVPLSTDVAPTSGVQLLEEIVSGAGRPYLNEKQDWVDIQVDKPVWERAQQWLEWRQKNEGLLPENLLSGERRPDVWAQQFALIFPAPDEDVMLGWFANAVMSGFDWGRSVTPMTTVTLEVLEDLCEVSHNEYETQAVIHGWKTQDASRVPWRDVPEPNRETVRASLTAVIRAMGLQVV